MLLEKNSKMKLERQARVLSIISSSTLEEKVDKYLTYLQQHNDQEFLLGLALTYCELAETNFVEVSSNKYSINFNNQHGALEAADYLKKALRYFNLIMDEPFLEKAKEHVKSISLILVDFYQREGDLSKSAEYFMSVDSEPDAKLRLSQLFSVLQDKDGIDDKDKKNYVDFAEMYSSSLLLGQGKLEDQLIILARSRKYYIDNGKSVFGSLIDDKESYRANLHLARYLAEEGI